MIVVTYEIRLGPMPFIGGGTVGNYGRAKIITQEGKFSETIEYHLPS